MIGPHLNVVPIIKYVIHKHPTLPLIVTSRGVRVTSRGYRYWYLNVVPIIIVLVVPRLIVRIALYSVTILVLVVPRLIVRIAL